ncbi:MAG: hypothetical protein IPK91_02725 [Saprospiraceae bacterium]|nr:hypothetical protein [Saprospiraceae bacterium]MBK8296204.1 hypothetical protein [Saprospiraceae bacterium]
MTFNWKIAFATVLGIILLGSSAKSQSNDDPELDEMVKLFLDSLTKSFGPLNEAQAKSVAQIVLSFLNYGDRDLRKLAYILATAWHESKLLLVKEKRCAVGTNCYKLQEAYWYSNYYGRGFVQLTHEDNYKRIGNALGVPLASNPDLALDRVVSADILVRGMMEGLFTGVALSRYIYGAFVDYFNARKVVNRIDQAELIAGYTASIIKQLEYPIA